VRILAIDLDLAMTLTRCQAGAGTHPRRGDRAAGASRGRWLSGRCGRRRRRNSRRRCRRTTRGVAPVDDAANALRERLEHQGARTSYGRTTSRCSASTSRRPWDRGASRRSRPPTSRRSRARCCDAASRGGLERYVSSQPADAASGPRPRTGSAPTPSRPPPTPPNPPYPGTRTLAAWVATESART
jgi:hypothetical protein